jgi:hypothetical protein
MGGFEATSRRLDGKLAVRFGVGVRALKISLWKTAMRGRPVCK